MLQFVMFVNTYFWLGGFSLSQFNLYQTCGIEMPKISTSNLSCRQDSHPSYFGLYEQNYRDSDSNFKLSYFFRHVNDKVHLDSKWLLKK